MVIRNDYLQKIRGLMLAMPLVAGGMAYGELLVYEPFDVDSLETLTNGVNGGIGWADGSVWSYSNIVNKTENDLYSNFVSYELAENLKIGKLKSEGGALRISSMNQSSGWLRRPMNLPKIPQSGGSFWVSCVIKYTGPVASGMYQNQVFRWKLMRADENSEYGSQYTFLSSFIDSGEWNNDICASVDVNGKEIHRASWNDPPVPDETYFMLTSVTNCGLGNWNGDKRIVLHTWILDRSDFAAVQEWEGFASKSTVDANEAFIQLLNDNCRASLEEQQGGDWGTGNLQADDAWQIETLLENYNPPHAYYILDELRLGDTLKDVMPVETKHGLVLMFQ